MTGCCGTRGGYASINDGEMTAPPKIGLCCGKTYKCLKEKNGLITQVAFFAFAALVSGLASYLSYNPHVDPIENHYPLYPFLLSAVGACVLFSSVGEGVFCCTSFAQTRRLPSPCTVTFGGIVVSTIVAHLNLQAANQMIVRYQANATNVTIAENALISACRNNVFADPRAFTNESCSLCDQGYITADSTWSYYPMNETCQLYPVQVDMDICMNQNDPINWIRWEWLESIQANTSVHAEDYPCNILYPTIGNDTVLETMNVLAYLAMDYDLNRPLILNVTVVNQSCKHLNGFANLKYPISYLCNMTRKRLPAYPFEMPCQTAYSTAYFNLYTQNFSAIKNAALPKPQRAINITAADPLFYWIIASSVSAALALGYEVLVCCRFPSMRKSGALLIEETVS